MESLDRLTQYMKRSYRFCLIVALLPLAVVLTQARAGAQTLSAAALATRAKVRNVPEIPYESVPNFLKLPPNLFLGEGIGIATNSKGHIFVYTRSQRTRLFEFDQNGNFVREIGEGSTALCSLTRCGSIRRTISGPLTKAPIWSSSSIPKAAS